MVGAEELRVRLWHKRYLRTRDERVFQRIWHQVEHLVTAPYQNQFPECAPGHWNSVKMLAVLQGLNDYNSKHQVVTQQVVEIPFREVKRRTITVPKLIRAPDGEIQIIQEERSITVPGVKQTKLKIIEVSRQSVMTLLSFLRFRMEQAIKAECRDLLFQRRTVALDNTYAEDDDHSKGDEIIFTRLADRSKLFPKDPEQAEDAYQALVQAVEERLSHLGETEILRAFRLKLKYPAITNRKIAATLKVSRTYTSGYFRKLGVIMTEVLEETDTLLT